MLIDESEIIVSGGHGGAGLVSFGKMWKSGPDGGNGGRGGDFYVVAVNDITLLNQFSKENEFSAENGLQGGRNKKTGKNGTDFELKLPVGTTIVEIETVRENGLVTSGETIELTKEGQRVLIAKGGLGGRGNWEFRSPRRTTPQFAQSGLPGEKRILKINLKLIADIGLLGLPNAGKSSLLNELTNAKAKIGSYAFTTLSPNLGSFGSSVIADIPGLIEGASEGKGLGLKFLKHIEKTKILVHCISSETEDLKKDYETIRSELSQFSENFALKHEVILLTKSDLVTEEKREKLLREALKIREDVYFVSIFDLDSINQVSRLFSSLLTKEASPSLE